MRPRLKQKRFNDGSILQVLIIAAFTVCFSSENGSNKVQLFLRDAEILPWELSVDSAAAYFASIGFDSCVVRNRNNQFTLGPSVSCKVENLSVGIGYHWTTIGDLHYIPVQAFYSVLFPSCKECSQAYKLVQESGYIPTEADPAELKMVTRTCIDDSLNKTVRIEVWNECCPGNRLRIYRAILGK